MKKNFIYLSGLIFILLSIAIWAIYGMLHVGVIEDAFKVSVILNNSNSDRWTALREGFEQAANDNHIELNIVSTTELTSIDEEIALMRREVENGADGLVIQMISSEYVSAALEDLSGKVAIVLLETDVTPEELYTTVLPDNQAIGRAIGKALVDSLGEKATQYEIGILSGNQKQLSMQQRLKALEEVLTENQIAPAWILSKQTGDMQAQMKKRMQEHKVDILLTLSNEETEAAVDVLVEDQESYYGIYGEGDSEKAVYYLDKGLIHTLVVPNEFNMGYQSGTIIAKQLQYRQKSTSQTKIEYLVVNQEDLYEEEYQKVVFPIVQ